MKQDSKHPDVFDISKAVIELLPRELRDQIYTYVIGVSRGRTTICDGKLPHYLRSICNTMQSHHSFWNPISLHNYIDPSRVDKRMALEIVENYYATTTFYYDYHELYLMHKFLTVDCFGLNLQPADFVRSIEIVLDEAYKCRCNAKALLFHKLLPEQDCSPETAIQECFYQLFRLKANFVRIKVILYDVRGLRNVKSQQELLMILHPILCELDRKGHHVVLEIFSAWGSEWSLEGFSEMSLEHLLQITR
ncbi:hypothetical protein DM02DRAFT_331889 [Periconia macrospinosa]|uniref:Uncharacterized protein n=1 Tax=Periconia macrospinosa TaxID=97972 RepID=A0A2V1DV08_9PLEO|nr:hypothetical protein DM02DRAFT_331889 [Periconia macrospinosa]